MLVVGPEAHEQLVKALLHALGLGVEQQFLDRLAYLHRYMSPSAYMSTSVSCEHSLCKLYKDFAPHSFGFSIWPAKLLEETDDDGYQKVERGDDGKALYDIDQRPFMVGGLIFHSGAGIDDGTFSVEINSEAEPHWSIHT